jgi:transcriptional regulator with XRE-family HTH domain
MSAEQLTDAEWKSRRFHAARSLLGMSLEQFAVASSVDINILVGIESGDAFPDLPTWRRILDCIRHHGVRPTKYGVEFDPEIVTPPERAMTLWSTEVMQDPYF